MAEPLTLGQIFKSIPVLIGIGTVALSIGGGWWQILENDARLDERTGRIRSLEIKVAVLSRVSASNTMRIQGQAAIAPRVRKLENQTAVNVAQFQEIIRRLSRLDDKVDRLRERKQSP